MYTKIQSSRTDTKIKNSYNFFKTILLESAQQYVTHFTKHIDEHIGNYADIG